MTLNPATLAYVKSGGVLPPPRKAGKWSKRIQIALGLAGLAGATYVATHTREEMDEVRGKVIEVLSKPVQYLDKQHRRFVNETYGEGHYPEGGKTLNSRPEVDALMKKNAATEEAIRRDHPDQSAKEIVHSEVWEATTFGGQKITPEEEERRAQELAKTWRKKWDAAGIPHN